MSRGAAYAANQIDEADELVEKNLGIVKQVAYHLSARLPSSVQVDDLIQSGVIGLIEAARRYNPGMGTSFRTFAVTRVRGAMLDDLRRWDWMPRSVHKQAREISKVIRKLENEKGREAKGMEIAAALGLSAAEYDALLVDLSNQNLICFDELVRADEAPDGATIFDSRSPAHDAEREQMIDVLAAAFDLLPEREQLVLSLYYDDELSLKEIGGVLKVSESRVSQLLSQARLRLGARVQEQS